MASCCVEGCFNEKNKNNSSLSFHTFPFNPFLRKKWLWAIGRLDWEPQSYSRVCSAHFRAEDLIQVGNKTRIKHDACPINNSMPAQKLVLEDICRICLATDIKMYSVKTGELRLYIDSIPGFSENFESDGMPQCVCYECAVQLKKCWLLVKKSMTSKKILLDMSTQNVQMDKDLLNLFREYYELKLPLIFHKKTPMRSYKYLYDEEKNISVLTNKEFITIDEENDDEARYVPNIWRHVHDTFENNASKEKVSDTNNEAINTDSDNELNTNDDHQQEEEIYVMEINGNVNDDFANLDPIDVSTEPIELISVEEPVIDIKPEVIEVPKDLICRLVTAKKRNLKTPKKPKRKPGEKKSIRINGLTPDEIFLQKYFDIVQIITVQDQIDDWKQMIESSIREGRKNALKCEVCSKYYVSSNALAKHVPRHDPKRGNVVCPVCKLRYKYERELRRHRNTTHSRRFHCRSCTKVYRSVTAARAHHQFHSGYRHKCKQCSYSTLNKSSLFTHLQHNHSHLACEICGRSCNNTLSLHKHKVLTHNGYTKPEGGEVYPCEDCKLNFNSENARRVHLLISKQHREVSRNDPALHTACKECGSSFLTLHELLLHKNAEHRPYQPPYQPSHPAKRTEQYPIQCKYCDAYLVSRFENYWHVRREHNERLPEYKRSALKEKMGAICDKCGKGFHSSAHLRQHELRHGSPRERCDQCGRMFFDSGYLARHVAVTHRKELRFTCDVCGRAFGMKGNLQRHMRIHLGVRPYKCPICGKRFRQDCARKLHVRTVHLNMPHPPRKRRKPKARNITAKDSDTSD